MTLITLIILNILCVWSKHYCCKSESVFDACMMLANYDTCELHHKINVYIYIHSLRGACELVRCASGVLVSQ